MTTPGISGFPHELLRDNQIKLSKLKELDPINHNILVLQLTDLIIERAS